MVQTIEYYNKIGDQAVAPSYDIQTGELNSQIAGAQNDPYYTSLLSGLEATKNREFSGIESRAAQRGVAYGNIPSQAQGAYLGEKYLPAVAEVKKTQSDYINNLKMKLADLRAQRASAASEYGFKLWQTDIDREEKAKDRAAAAARSASSGSSGELTDAQMKALANNDAYAYARNLMAAEYKKTGGVSSSVEKARNYLETNYRGYLPAEKKTQWSDATRSWQSFEDDPIDSILQKALKSFGARG